MTEDLIQGSFNARNLPLEIGCRGVRNAANLEYICNQVWIGAIKKLKGAFGRIALIGSHVFIFHYAGCLGATNPSGNNL